MPDQYAIIAPELHGLVDRIERLEAGKTRIADDIKDVYAEAKALGYNAKILRKVVVLRRKSADDRREEEELLEVYMQAVDAQGELFEKQEAA